MNIELLPMTRARMHELYRKFAFDPDTFMDMELFEEYKHYVYDPQKVDARFERRKSEGNNRFFAIMLSGAVIGEVSLRHIDAVKKECELGIHLQNDSVKNRGYGTQAERLAIRYAFDELGMDRILANSIVKNTRSQHVLKKLGFTYAGEGVGFKKYCLERKEQR